MSTKETGLVIATGIFVTTIIIAACMYVFPVYMVWQQEKSGEAKFREAEWSRQIAIEEANARKESSVLDAEAEIIRARGLAEANEIIGGSLKNNPEYLTYLWIQGLHDGSSETIYIPTEANLPILEANRRGFVPAGD